MKITFALLAAAVLAPLTLSAQSPGAGGGSEAAPPSPGPATPNAPRLPQVQFGDGTLQELVEHLQGRSKAAGHDPHTDPLNVIISPGLEEHRVPALSLRNVSPTEVLTVATTVLGLRFEPVIGDNGQPVAWLIKGTDFRFAPMAGSIAANPPPMPHAKPGLPGVTAFAGAPGAANPLAAAPYAVQLAGSLPAGVPAGGSGSQGISRVFGIASIIASDQADSKAREKEQVEKLHELIGSLEKIAGDHGGKARINAYREMDLLVVKSADPDVVALLAEAIEAMKSNAAKGGNVHQAAAEALRTELNALKGQLSITEKEKQMQRQTLLDQIDLLKAARKAEASPR